MFRELSRRNKQISKEECAELLTKEKRGVLAVNGDDGYPYAMPMNHYYCHADGCVYFHCGRGGHRLDSIKKCDKVSFAVTEQGIRESDDFALTVRSVIIFGRISIIDDINEVTRITAELCRKFTDDEAYIEREIQLYGHETLLLKLTPEHICGKKVKES